jgi:hypothetical protein
MVSSMNNLHIEIELENWKDLIEIASKANLQIFVDKGLAVGSNKLWFSTIRESWVSIFSSSILDSDLDALDESGDVSFGKIIRGTIEVVRS